jgi:hypothetical protein
MNSMNKCLIKSRQPIYTWLMALILAMLMLSSVAMCQDWSGTWHINWANEGGREHYNIMTLWSTGKNAYAGTYDHHGGQINGRVSGFDGNSLQGTWTEDDNQDGTFLFTMNADGTFTGTWDYSHGDPGAGGGHWDGKR